MSTGTAESRTGLLEGRNVLVTGGSSGIGRGIATVCAREGARVAFTYATNAEGADATLAIVRAHGTGLAIRADLRIARRPRASLPKWRRPGEASTCSSTTRRSARSFPSRCSRTPTGTS